MKLIKEIEFKSRLTKTEYENLLRRFSLTEQVSKHVNYYFDTPELSLFRGKITLRIREKADTFMLTRKTKSVHSSIEKNIILDAEDTKNFLDCGFNARIIGIDKEVYKMCELVTYRVSCPYKDGQLFFDKSEYYNTIDYEVEYEVNNYEQGLSDFQQFLLESKLPYRKLDPKSVRAFTRIQKVL